MENKMSYHIPICPVCNENEVGSFIGSEFFCSAVCEAEAQAEMEAFRFKYDADYDDLAYEEDSGSPIDTDRMERESEWMYGHDLDGYEYAGFDA
jgi:hypothetical protein